MNGAEINGSISEDGSKRKDFNNDPNATKKMRITPPSTPTGSSNINVQGTDSVTHSSNVSPVKGVPMQGLKNSATTVTNISKSNIPIPSVSVTSTVSGTNPVLNLPSHSSWFNIKEINDIEKNALPEFFDGQTPSRTPEVYKEYRDFMINAYQQNPSQYLTQTACRRNLSGDVCSILRVHSFLEYWGLINFNIAPDMSTPLPVQLTGTSGSSVAPLQQLVDFETKTKQEKAAATATPVLSTHKEVFAPSHPQFKCTVCGNDCTKSRYVSSNALTTKASTLSTFINFDKKAVVHTLCPSCYASGKFPENLSGANFFRVDATVDPQYATYSNEWTDQETLLLLEALEKHPDDWDSVAEQVGTKSKEQCILHFIRLPIEDPYLEDQLVQAYKQPAGGRSIVEDGDGFPILNKDDMAFAGASNPLMAMVAFIASVISPSVAAAAAQAALDNLEKQHEANPDIAENNIKEAAATAVAAASLKAKYIAQKEEKEITTAVSKIVDLQLRKLELKMTYFEDIEMLLDRERNQIEKARQQLYAEQMAFNAQKLNAQQQQPRTPSVTTPTNMTM